MHLPIKSQLLCLTALATIVSGCAPHIAGSERPPTILPANDVYYTTQTIVGPCDDAAEALPLLPAIASAIVAQGVNRIGDAIKAASETETKVVTARRNVELRQGAKGLGPCVTVVRGWFYRAPPAYEPLSPFHTNTGSASPLVGAAEAAAYWRQGLHMAGTPDFYFQGRIVASTDRTAYTVLPVRASLDRPISTTPLRPGGKRSVMVSFAFSEVGKAVDLQKGGGTTIVLGQMSPGKLMTFSEVSCFAQGTDGKLSPTKSCPAAGSFDTLIRSPFESEWFSVSLGDKSKPMMVQALVSETRSPSQFLAFVADVFGATKGRLTEELQQAIIPSVGNDAVEADLTAREKLANDADAAQGKAINELKACVAAPADAAKRASARAALRSYIQAARKAERKSGAVDAMVTAISTNGTDAAVCEAALNAVLSD